MEFLAANGLASVIHDLRGHGASVRTKDDLGYMYKGGWRALVEDIEDVRKWAVSRWQGTELTLLGHSMGSLAVRSYIKTHDDRINRLIISGSPSFNPLSGIGKFLADFFWLFRGSHYRSPLLQALSFGAYNKPFKDEGYASAWVCSDKAILEAYHNDPLCQYVFTANGFSNLTGMMQDCYSLKGWKVSNPALPICLISGELDPCRGTDKQHQFSIDLLRKAGYASIESRIFKGMRHEVLNETDKQKVWDHVLEFILCH